MLNKVGDVLRQSKDVMSQFEQFSKNENFVQEIKQLYNDPDIIALQNNTIDFTSEHWKSLSKKLSNMAEKYKDVKEALSSVIDKVNNNADLKQQLDDVIQKK